MARCQQRAGRCDRGIVESRETSVWQCRSMRIVSTTGGSGVLASFLPARVTSRRIDLSLLLIAVRVRYHTSGLGAWHRFGAVTQGVG